MRTPSTILIFSENEDFAEPLANLAAREFSAICKISSDKSNLPHEKTDLLVSDQPVAGNLPFPVINVSLPVRVRDLFSQMAEKLNKSSGRNTIKIGENLHLSLQNKVLSDESGFTCEDLTDKETRLLQAISLSGEDGIAREELLKNIWGVEAELDTHTLETHIYRLRKKIRDIFGQDMIKAVDGCYKL